MRSVVITGTSTGIGFAAAKVLIDQGFRVFGSVRKAADAERLRQQLGANFVPLVFDVTDEAAVRAGAETVHAALSGETLAGLVNNAGIAVSGPLLELSVDEFRRQMEVNVTGVVIATKAFAPLLGADRTLKGPPGRVVMIGSVAGQNGNPLLAPYSTSKFAIEGLSESLRREFMLFGIDVILIGPGAVKTPIWDKAEEIDIARFSQSPFLPALERLRTFMLTLARTGLPPEQIGALVHHVLTTPRPRVRYAVSPEPLQLLLAKILPKRLIDRIIAKRLGLLPAGNG
ncbi:SDR family NAD(P)-dependent oxidoreductase [Bradyrhizobium sp. 2TAF24]|uniref:SDR family NAD(P)-dependent oxidoreductase n=1 Tax=Bradyrhizobium sp. 2TAF24 TaxID=3233011 RepID=UPI003F8DCC3C